MAEHQLDVLPELLDFVRRCCSILRFASYVADLVRLVVATCRHVYPDGCDRRGLEHGGHCGDAWQLFLCHNFSLILLDYSSDASSVVSHHTVGDCSRLRERCLHVSIDLQLLRAIDHHMWTRVRVAVSMKRAPVCNGCRYVVYCSVMAEELRLC